MPVYTIPCRPEALEDLSRHCAELGLGEPRCWRHVHLHRTIRDLVSSPELFESPDDCALDARVIGVADPVVFFCNLPPAEVGRVVAAFRRERQWPIFSVITRHALEMTLAVLIEHLLHDRTTEARARARARAATESP